MSGKLNGRESDLKPKPEPEHFKRVTHRSCEYFPCHKGVPLETFNCLFCFCPLYLLKDQCGGNFKYRDNGVKDCTNCTVPHGPDSYERVMDKMSLVIEGAKMLP